MGQSKHPRSWITSWLVTGAPPEPRDAVSIIGRGADLDAIYNLNRVGTFIWSGWTATPMGTPS